MSLKKGGRGEIKERLEVKRQDKSKMGVSRQFVI